MFDVSEAIHAEVEVCLQALSFASDLGTTRVEVETYAINLKATPTISKYDNATCGVLFRDIKFFYVYELHRGQSRA